MSTAQNTPVMRRKAEINTGDFPVGQKDPIKLNLDDPMPDRQEIAIAPAMDGGKHLSKYMQDLQFGEDPVTIRIEPGQGKFAPKVWDCWVNGVGAEQLIGNQWVKKGWLPVGTPTTTKRKYVENLLRAKHDNIQTSTIRYRDSEDNIVERHTSSATPITIIRDDSPASRDWIEKILREG